MPKYPWRGLKGFAILRPMNLTAVYAKNPQYIQRDVAGECILVPIRRNLTESNSIYVLNETGAALWQRIDGTRSLRTITDEFAQDTTSRQNSCIVIFRPCSLTYCRSTP